MTLYEYQLLSPDVQACILWEQGVYLATRTTSSYSIELYQVEGFYIEVFYKLEDSELKYLKGFSSVEFLTPYLNQISLTGLF